MFGWQALLLAESSPQPINLFFVCLKQGLSLYTQVVLEPMVILLP